MALVAGHPLPDPSQDSGTSFWEGALDYRRISGRVLALPEWQVTDAHRESAAQLGSADGLVAAVYAEGPTVLGLIACVFVFRWAVMNALVRPAARYLVPPAPAAKRQKTLDRFESAGWEAIFYTLSCSYGFFVFQHESWSVWPTSNIWDGWPLQPFDQVFRGYYLLGLAFYSQALLSLLLLDEPRSDFVEYLVHHLVTIFLISARYERVPRPSAGPHRCFVGGHGGAASAGGRTHRAALTRLCVFRACGLWHEQLPHADSAIRLDHPAAARHG
jgi:hypothetical protein